MDFRKSSTGESLMWLGSSLMGLGDQLPKSAVLEEGWVIAIDVDWTRKFPSGKDFSREDVKTVGKDYTDLHSGLADLEGLLEQRQEYIASIEQQSRHANNHS
ncbi:10093_t:CDS:1 [Ambispora gerdemannii]|uniref:10093_t:CDS:1 n=1 Tax=Ambispora gerdemannii TaxID=144530 RepID=A0A9N9DZL8_9GLOM|nr:10093_t:CDS:1 [Ambispora gerdemannii]